MLLNDDKIGEENFEGFTIFFNGELIIKFMNQVWINISLFSMSCVNFQAF